MKKIYCKNCKWNSWWTLECLRFKAGQSIYSGNKIEEISFDDQYKHNNDKGECPYYKRKWWKFWIK